MHSPRKGSWRHFTQNNAPCPSSFLARLAGTRGLETGGTGSIPAGAVYRSTNPGSTLAVRLTAVCKEPKDRREVFSPKIHECF
jgi:hypothetical protein